MRPNVFLLIIVMALTVYIVRLVPILLFRKEIKSRFLKRFFHYTPYTVIAAMTFPMIFFSTGSLFTACAGFVVGCVLSYFRKPFLIVALGACVAVYLAGMIPF